MFPLAVTLPSINNESFIPPSEAIVFPVESSKSNFLFAVDNLNDKSLDASFLICAEAPPLESTNSIFCVLFIRTSSSVVICPIICADELIHNFPLPLKL